MVPTTVPLMHYDPSWPQQFEQTRSNILAACDGLVVAVEHIGGTAISGLIARPTIDAVAMVAESDSIPTAALLIEGLNYRVQPKTSWCDSAWVLTKPRYLSSTQTATNRCIYLLASESPFWKSALAIRDLLRRDRRAAIDFEQAKLQSWKESEGDLERYNSEKAEIFAQLHSMLPPDFS
ncbi:dephospho-CoA kinase/protein folding accessory domain-containing protein [Novipirellula artificiosorum]|uniref:Dephospho-CoA kinase/protein folding accessory domain-containing protein n=2 Tax=Novipirellula artificiosorum TaxID=2528016 RepID=A0A5C6E0R1_9BACT|nr:dephospho-CoA kinase/protein folding accessory domain-containing protein [Novipirellula artificiosorum]